MIDLHDPQRAPAGTDWLYLQVFLHRPPVPSRPGLRACADELLTDVVGPAAARYRAAGWARRSFFIRYGEEGYHLRLRFLGDTPDGYTPLTADLAERVAGFFARHPELLAEGERPDPESLWASGRIRRSVYEPELAKYGGPAGLALAERHFGHSSELAVQVLEAERDRGIARSQFALELLHILLELGGYQLDEQMCMLKSYTYYWRGVAEPDELARIDDSLERNYQRLQDRLARRLQPGEPGPLERGWAGFTPNFFQGWRDHLVPHLAALKAAERSGALVSPLPADALREQALRAAFPNLAGTPVTALLIVPNYLHLLNNRLGISPLQEIQLTYLLYRWMEDRFQRETPAYPLVLEPDYSNVRLAGRS